MMDKETVEAQIKAIEEELTQFSAKTSFTAKIRKGQLKGKINELKRHPVFWPEICHKLHAWRGERGLREVFPLFAEREDVTINMLARIENGHTDYDTELLKFIEKIISPHP